MKRHGPVLICGSARVRRCLFWKKKFIKKKTVLWWFIVLCKWCTHFCGRLCVFLWLVWEDEFREEGHQQLLCAWRKHTMHEITHGCGVLSLMPAPFHQQQLSLPRPQCTVFLRPLLKKQHTSFSHWRRPDCLIEAGSLSQYGFDFSTCERRLQVRLMQSSQVDFPNPLSLRMYNWRQCRNCGLI